MIWPWTEIKRLCALVDNKDRQIAKLCYGLSQSAAKLIAKEEEIIDLKFRIAELGEVDGSN